MFTRRSTRRGPTAGPAARTCAALPPGPPPTSSCACGRRPVKEPQGVLAVVARDLAELIEDPLLVGAGALAVARMDGSEVFPFGLVAHDVPLVWAGGRKGYVINGATIPTQVTF